MKARCTYCGGEHGVQLCPHTWGGSVARERLYCSYCGSRTHSVRYCPETASGPKNRRDNKNGDFID